MSNTYDVRLIPLAEKDLQNIYDYIANTLGNVSAANKLVNDFVTVFKTMAIMPYSYPKINNGYVKDKELRKAVVNNYIAFYKVDDDKRVVYVVRIIYGMSNYQSML